DLRGVTIAVQGLGDVGLPLVEELSDRGATLLVADLDSGKVGGVVERFGAVPVPPDEITTTECDVFAPCALGAVVNARSVFRTPIVAGSANNVFATPDDAERAHHAGITVVPDYIINAGGALAVTMMGEGVTDRTELMKRVERIGGRVAEILAEASASDVPPVVAAQRRVDRLLAERGSPRYR
ncbi:MAG: hypothetical protein OEW30_10145, partial [Acidimicrobiia bacterium]|nr:hypothetical protein [Acidimicrobiia bacterium]